MERTDQFATRLSDLLALQNLAAVQISALARDMDIALAEDPHNQGISEASVEMSMVCHRQSQALAEMQRALSTLQYVEEFA
jgi:hypothetical protein